MPTLEVCVDCLESVANATKGGCDRLELCSALSVGGLTPSPALLQMTKSSTNLPIYCMVRCRDGDMVFSSEEGELMLQEAKDLVSRGADGLVFGALTSEGGIDKELCIKMRKVAGSLPLTFHRAFDLLENPLTQLEEIISMGYNRILTSGCKPSAVEGSETIGTLVSTAMGRIAIMAGAGVKSSNVKTLVKNTGVTEVHASAKCVRVTAPSSVRMGSSDDSIRYITDGEEVRALVTALKK